MKNLNKEYIDVNGFNFEMWSGYCGAISPTLQRERASDTLVYGIEIVNGEKRIFVRRLLPVETERLMGFPDNHTKIKWNGKSEEECVDGLRYNVCGNSFCVNPIQWIGKRIQMVEDKINKE